MVIKMYNIPIEKFSDSWYNIVVEREGKPKETSW
jgi:hypothetical protein